MTDAKRDVIDSTVDYMQGRIYQMWGELATVKSVEGRASLLEAIGELRADLRRFEIANSEAQAS